MPRAEPLLPAALTIGAAAVAAALLGLGGTDLVRTAAPLLGALVVFAALPNPPPAPRGRRAITLVGLFLAVWLLAVLSVEVLPELVNPGPSVAEAVGGASYAGTPYAGAQLAAVAAVAAVCAAALFTAVRLGRVAPTGSGGDPPGDLAATAATRRHRRIVIAGSALVAFTLVPDLRQFVLGASQPIIGWDAANLVLWDYLVNQGLEPMEDFFYPYGFQWVFSLFPEGQVIRWLGQVAIVALAGWALWRLSGRRPFRVICCLLVLALLLTVNPNAVRYFAALTIPLTYAAIGPACHQRLTPAHLVFGGACLLAVFWEADLLLFGAAGVALVIVGELCSGRLRWEPRRLGRALLIDGVPVLAAAALLVLAWLAIGTAENNARWFLGLASSAAYSATDQTEGAIGTLSVWPSPTSLQVALPCLLAVGGLLHALFNRDRDPGVAPVLLGGAGIVLLLLLKNIVRPVEHGLLIAAAVLLWAAILLWRPRPLAIAVLVGVAFGAAALSFERQYTAVSRYLEDAVASPVSAARSIALAWDSETVADASRQRFDFQRFAGDPEVNALREYLLAARGGARPGFAVIGDAQLLYPVLRERPPYHGQLYDASPISEQRELIAALDRADPPLLIWRRDLFWEGVPYHVRTPLVFSHVIDRYLPTRRGLATDVLRRRRPAEAIDTEYWRRRLGPRVDLGFIPSWSMIDEAPACSGGENCADIAVVEGEPHGTGEVVTLQLRGRSGSFEVALRAREGLERYPVRLDRVWFWPLLDPETEIRSQTPGWSVRRTRVHSDDLY